MMSLEAKMNRFFTVITFLLAIVLSNSSVAIAAPKIEWTPREVEVTLSEQHPTDSVPATFTSDIALDQITLEVVPGLSDLVTVEPAVIQNVQAGVSHTVALNFSLPPGTEPGVYEGVVHVRSGQRTLPHTLKIRISVEAAAASEFLLGTDLPPHSPAEFAVYISQSIAQGFSLTAPISITELKLQMSGFGSDQFVVWVTNSIGPGTTQANVLLQTTATFPNTGGGTTGSTISIPMNLSLPPGDYFIVLSSTQPSVLQGWLMSTTTLPSTVDSLSDMRFVIFGNVLFPPASEFITLGDRPAAFQIFGTK
jgi:hypothetical protein